MVYISTPKKRERDTMNPGVSVSAVLEHLYIICSFTCFFPSETFRVIVIFFQEKEDSIHHSPHISERITFVYAHRAIRSHCSWYFRCQSFCNRVVDHGAY